MTILVTAVEYVWCSTINGAGERKNKVMELDHLGGVTQEGSRHVHEALMW